VLAETLQDRPFADLRQEVRVPNALTSGITSVTVLSGLRSTVMPSAGKTLFSWSSVYVPAGTVGSNSPWTMLCAR
jgi:hypothetical protein